MPHTSHRKKQPRTKRANVVDEHGWTRVATTNVRSQTPQLPFQAKPDLQPTPTYSAARPADGMTNEKLYQQFQEVEKRWLASTSWKRLYELLNHNVDRQTIEQLEHAIVFGTGSFGGVREGWIERSEVCLYQLSAFKAVLDTLESMTGKRPSSRAQDPVYNDLDAALLKRLNIDKVDHPVGFEDLTPRTFVYAPCAELAVQIRCLQANPLLTLLTGKLDFHWRNAMGDISTNRAISFDAGHEIFNQGTDGGLLVRTLQERLKEQMEVIEEFQKDKDVSAVPDLDVKDFPFHDTYLYSRRSSVEIRH